MSSAKGAPTGEPKVSPLGVPGLRGPNGRSINLWDSAGHAESYLERRASIPHRVEGYTQLVDHIPPTAQRVLDLGTGDGELVARLKHDRPDRSMVAIDFSATMLEAARARFGDDPSVEIVEHDLDRPLPDGLGAFDAVVSSFAIHHVDDDRKRALYAEVLALLAPGGVFCNLEHVASPTPVLHEQFLAAIGYRPEDDDPSNKLLDVETQLRWLRELGFVEVDCHWKWRELALLAGQKPAS